MSFWLDRKESGVTSPDGIRVIHGLANSRGTFLHDLELAALGADYPVSAKASTPPALVRHGVCGNAAKSRRFDARSHEHEALNWSVTVDPKSGS